MCSTPGIKASRPSPSKNNALKKYGYFFGIYAFLSLFHFWRKKGNWTKCYVMAWLMGILLTRQEPIIFFLINTEPHHQHHSYRQYDHDLRLQNGQYCWRAGHMSWRNGISSCPFCRYWKNFSRKKNYKSSFLPFLHNKYFLFFRVWCLRVIYCTQKQEQ